MQIAKLPEEVQSFIRTGVTITSISQCVIELVLNSLDASASRVGVRIDLSKHQVQVVDDGCGLNLEQLNLIGNRYMTSKCNTLADLQGNLKYYGYRGEAIASIKQVCDSLIIISKPKGENVTYCKVLKPNEDENDKAVEAKLDRPGHGTTVVVINVFSNFPVRQKQLQHSLEVEQIKNELQTIALIQPQVSFTLRNDVTKSVILQTDKCTDIIQNFHQIFENEEAVRELIYVSFNECNFGISAYISRETVKTNKLQFIYVNKRYVKKNKLYAFVNKQLKKSFYLKTVSCKLKNICSSGNLSGIDFDSADCKDDCAIFIINIECPYSEYDICLDPKKQLIEFKDWDLLFSCIEKCVAKYLQMEDDLHDFSNKDELVKIVDEDTDKKMMVHERKINVNTGGISHESLNLNDANCNTSAVKNITVFKKDFQNCVMFSGSKKSIAHSEHVLTECDECKTPYLLKGSNNVVMESIAGDNNQSIIPVVCKDFYENNLLLLKHNFQLINKTTDDRMSCYVTPMNIISDHHKNISVKELRKRGRYDNSCSSIRADGKLKCSKNKKVRFNNNIVFIKKTNDNYLKKSIKCHKKENTIYNRVSCNSSKNITHQKGFFKPSYRIHSKNVNYNYMKKRIHCDGYNVSPNNFINNYANASQISCAKSYENNNKNFSEYNNLNECENCNYHKFNTASNTSYVDSFCNYKTDKKFLDNSKNFFLFKNKLPCDVKCEHNLAVSSDVMEIKNRENTPCLKTKDIKSHTNFSNKLLVDDYTQTSCKDLSIDQVEMSNYADFEVNSKSKDNEMKSYNTNVKKCCVLNSNDFINSNKMISKLNENKTFLQTDFLHPSQDDSTMINNNIRFKKKLLNFDISSLYKDVSVKNYNSRDRSNNFFNHNSRENLLLVETASGESNNNDRNNFMKTYTFKFPNKNNGSDHFQKTTEECFAKQSAVDSDQLNSVINDLSECFEKLKIDNYKNDIKMICTQDNFFTDPKIQSPCKEDSDTKRKFEAFKNEDYIADPSNKHYLLCHDKIDDDCSMIRTGGDHKSSPDFSHIRDEITVTDDKKVLYEEITNDKSIVSTEKRKNIDVDKDSSNGFNNFCGYSNTDFLFGNFGFNIKHVASKQKTRNNSVEFCSADNINNDNVINNNYGERIAHENCNFPSKTDRNAKQNLCDLSSLSPKRKYLFEIDNEINSGSSNNNKKICVHENFISKEIGKSLPNNCVNIISHENSSVQPEHTNKKTGDIMTGLQLTDEVKCLKEHKLPSGKYIYIHTDSGMSFYSPPKEVIKHNISSRCSFLPKGISPLQNSYLNYINNKINYCLQEEEKKEVINIIKKNYDKYIEESGSPFLKWKDHKRIGYDGTSNFDSFFNKTSIKCAVPLFKTYSFSKEDISNAKVVGVLDKKFITTVMSCSEEKFIVIFDQHAVDERIRYEHLFRSYKENDDGSFCCVPVNPPLFFSVSETKLEIINEFIETFYKIGLKFTINNKKVIVNSVPTCLYNRAEKENSGEANNKLLCLVNKLMDEQTEYIIKTGGIGMSVPDTLNSVISYEACRGAVKFGDDLSKTAAQSLIKQLSTCLMPFQCAHGRPVLTPVFSLG